MPRSLRVVNMRDKRRECEKARVREKESLLNNKRLRIIKNVDEKLFEY